MNFITILKKLIKLLTPPILDIDLWKNKLNKINKEKNKFNYEENFYSRHSFILKSIFKKKNCKYLEIGVSTNSVFNTIPLSLNNKIGVDPNTGGTHRMTSDFFFTKNKKKFDVIFIDGLHQYEQCQKDCINALKIINPGGIIIFHDFLPRNEKEGSAIRTQRDWCGDVWKVAVEINNSTNKDFVIVNIDMGVGLFKPKKNFKYKKMNKVLENKNFYDFYKHYLKKLPVVKSSKALKFI